MKYSALWLLLLTSSARGQSVDFSRDIEPIFRDHCYRCHGPEKSRGGLRLSNKKEAFTAADSGVPAIVAGKSGESPLLERIASTDDDKRMPPSGTRLTKTQIDTLKRWIDAGASWPESATAQNHWAFVAPKKPEPPAVKRADWVRNPIDRFILARLEKEGLQPSVESDRTRLIRRVTLDLIGLPPTLAEVDAFVKDTRSDAFERVVDRLLASPQYGERWARPWLDLARYADSNGFQRDGFRDLWAYRDYVVKAFNDDLPYDQFTREQMAGDLLPNATVDQKIATGFHRCTTVNVEAGTDQEENRVNQVFDRVNTTGTVWLGLTFECAQCHNHKYDPISQREYYRLMAFFNNTEIETQFRGKATAAIDFIGPALKMPDDDRAAVRAKLENELKQVNEEIKKDKSNKSLQEQKSKLLDQLAQVEPRQSLVMKELPQPRRTSVFRRGNFLDRGATVAPGTPEFLPALPEGPANRISLANWLVDPSNPLTARVAVNRFWAEFFGQGIVATLEDFGTKAEPPTHPELLDWLAVSFRDGGWSMKKIHRVIVASATYRQSSKVTPALLARDAGNKLYARGPRLRMDAEMIRDNALAVAGLLSLKQGGPPIRPYQPEGIWKVTGLVDNTYRLSQGEDRYRRGLYVVWRRSAPYPSFMNFDAQIRATCVVQRSRSNTPLQALTLLNDPVYVEAAEALAKRVEKETPSATVEEKIRHAFRLCLAREPEVREVDVLVRLHGQAPTPAKAMVELAATLLNLDETINK